MVRAKNQEGSKKSRMRFGFMHSRDFPLIILATGILLTVGIWDFTNRVRSEQIFDLTRHQADQIRIQMVNYFSSQLSISPRFASMITEVNSPLSEPLQKYWQSVFRDNPGVIASQMIDANTQSVIWTEVSKGEDPHTLDQLFASRIAHSEEWQTLSRKSVERNKLFVSEPLRLSPEKEEVGRFFYSVYPVQDASGKTFGFIVQYLDIRALLDPFFKGQALVYYHYLISHRWEILHSDLKFWKDPTAERPFKVTRQIDVADKSWYVNIWPREEYLAGQIQYEITGILVLTMGILLSISASLFAWSLVSRQETLEKLVKIRTEQLEQVNEALKAKNEELESFLYVVSHDLKAPLVSIKGFTSLLAGTSRDKLSEEEKHAIDRINANTSRMHEMIQDLLELSRVGRVEESVADVDTGKIVEDILDEMKPILEQKHVKVETDGNFPTVKASPIRLAQLFSNLIGNAVKYMGSQSEPRIEIGASQTDHEMFQFYVRDNGAGVPKEYQDKIFMVFQRGPNQNNTEGTGIGLSIVKKIVESQGGKVWLESEAGKGSVFFFTFPQ